MCERRHREPHDTIILLPGFTASSYIAAGSRYRAAVLTSVPTMIAMILRERFDRGSHRTPRWREMDSNPRSPVCGELGAPGPRATRPRAIVKPWNADRSRRQARRAICGMPGAPFIRTKPPSNWMEIGFGDPEHLAASPFAFSATFEICRDDTICRQGSCRNSGRQQDSLT